MLHVIRLPSLLLSPAIFLYPQLSCPQLQASVGTTGRLCKSLPCVMSANVPPTQTASQLSVKTTAVGLLQPAAVHCVCRVCVCVEAVASLEPPSIYV